MHRKAPFPTIPEPVCLWRTFRAGVWLLLAVLAVHAASDLLVEYWFLGSLGQGGVFATNFRMQLLLFAVGAVLFTGAVALPVRLYAARRTLRRGALHVGLWLGVFAGWMLAVRYQPFLLALEGGRFGDVDPVFGHDVGFYVFTLDALELVLTTLFWVGVTGCVASLLGRRDGLAAAREHDRETGKGGLNRRRGSLVTDGLNISAFVVGATLIGRTFLTRYGLLTADNERSGVRVGAELLDVEGALSTLNLIYVSTAVEAGVVAVVGYTLYRLSRGGEVVVRLPATLIAGLLAIELSFYVGVVVRDHVFIAPNEPSIQIPYIQRHMDATLEAYGLDEVRTVPWVPPDSALPVDAIRESRTVRNAPILPTWVSHLEEPPDVQHFERIEASASTLVYGPVLQAYEQEQQLRPYYHFISVDGVRYEIDGERRMYASAVRELPTQAFVGAQEWLRYWGSAALMYTHGFGLVMSPVNELDAEGGVVYAVGAVPPVTSSPTFEVEPRVYIGEGAKDQYILTSVRGLEEFDHATAQGRTEYVYPTDAADGIPVDSWFKRLTLAVHTKDVTAFLFSKFIDPRRTRVHVHRTPIDRLQSVAPFLFFDSNPYAFVADGRIVWMVNALTTSDRYPYSFLEVLGDKADERAVERVPERVINYAEDAVKATIDAFTGEVRFHRMTDDPIVRAWSRIYPSLFAPRDSMPQAVAAQLTYPLQWFHIQFDDIYKRYHQRHPIEFYNVEDLWDDADEVLGSIGRGLTEFGTTDQMTFSYEGHGLLVDPADLPDGGAVDRPPDPLQYAMLMPFTPEGAQNLRALIVAHQDPERYGELVSYRIPQGEFLPGPEQIDAYIDDDAQVNQQITLWVRHGSEVLRGHTLLLPVRGDVVYVEPLWITSLQNQIPQIKLVSIVYRGRTAMGTTLAEAIERLGISEEEEQRLNDLPWFRDGRSTSPVESPPRSGGAP